VTEARSLVPIGDRGCTAMVAVISAVVSAPGATVSMMVSAFMRASTRPGHRHRGPTLRVRCAKHNAALVFPCSTCSGSTRYRQCERTDSDNRPIGLTFYRHDAIGRDLADCENSVVQGQMRCVVHAYEKLRLLHALGIDAPGMGCALFEEADKTFIGVYDDNVFVM
jgi:hypothetical protein